MLAQGGDDEEILSKWFLICSLSSNLYTRHASLALQLILVNRERYCSSNRALLWRVSLTIILFCACIWQ